MSYRVEVYDGTDWTMLGIRINPNSRVPEFCSLPNALILKTKREAMMLQSDASRICGGTLRVAKVPD